ncbi:MAG TPA: protein kinase family protein [Streptosporangiaceae bacterium]|nr:protein kinase family protein [Streptosporangiaceae bacterium]
MSTFISEPGTRLGGRYRLEDRVNDSGGWSAWKAIDETLARPVAVLTFAPGFPRIREAVTAARAASRLTDARLAQVFDVEDDWDQAYVVMEWVAGDSLDDLLADGPLDPARGAEIVAEGAAALAVAHTAGLAHLCLTPQSLRWTPGGGVKVLGVGIDAALSDTTADDPELADTRGLAMLLYAALTRYWPGPGMGTLPPAPLSDGRPCSPRQVCAGVPASIDEVTCQALFQRDRRRGPPLTTPALFADALAEVIPAPLAPPPATPAPPPPRQAAFGNPTMSYRPDPGLDYPSPDGRPPQRVYRPSAGRDRRPAVSWAAIVLVGVIVLAAIVAGVYSLTRSSGGPSPHASAGGPSASPSTVANVVLTPVSAGGFDALGIASDPGNEDNAQANFAIDGNPTTAWHTQFYLNNPVFGGLKQGTGLLLDMGKQVSLSSVQITFGATAGANVAIEVGNDATIAPSALSTFTKVATQTNVGGGTQTFQTSSSAKGRYVLIWFTKLPPVPSNGGQFEAFIYNVVVRGSG